MWPSQLLAMLWPCRHVRWGQMMASETLFSQPQSGISEGFQRTPNDFQDRSDQPLRHPSARGQSSLGGHHGDGLTPGHA
jgi:hypothetical protein